jgi:predicted dehydrogenase
VNRALVVGSGSIAKRHIRNLREQFPVADVVCVSSSGRKLLVAEVGATEVADTIAQAVVHKPDIAIVASPANFHLAHAQIILDAGVPVLLEKPLCVDLADVSKFSLDSYRSKVGVGYNLRFLPAALIVKNLLSDGEIGHVSTVFSEVGQFLPDWRPDANYKAGVSARKDLGGGALLELSHELDYLGWFFGRFSAVAAVTGNSNLLNIDVEDSVDALFTNEKGTIFHLHLDFLQRCPSRSFKAIGAKGTLIWNLLTNEVQLLKPGSEPQIIFSDPDYDRNEMYVDQLQAFVKFSKGFGEFGSTLESSIEVMRLVEAIRKSDSLRTWVKLEAIK